MYVYTWSVITPPLQHSISLCPDKLEKCNKFINIMVITSNYTNLCSTFHVNIIKLNSMLTSILF